MEQALYRKYRPKTFAEMVGQNHIKTTLASELETGRLAHAYLFSGPRGLGKTTTARLLAKAVNCLKRKAGQSEPCNQCEACLELMNGKSLDVIEIDAASHTGVDNVRENIIENSRFTPTSRKFKIFIIDEVHMLSTSAFNALLKTLEEPPAHAMFILATTEIHKVPETIISRCQHFDFRKVSQQEIFKRLTNIVSQEKKTIDQTVLEHIAYFGQGCLRDAESLLGQVLSLDDKKITAEQAALVLPVSRFDLNLELISLLNKKDIGPSLALINQLVESGVDLEKFTSDLIEVARKMMLVKINPDLAEFGGALNKDLEKQLTSLAADSSLSFLVRVIEIMGVKKKDLRFAEIIQLPLELGALEIVLETDGPAAGSPVSQLKNSQTLIKPQPVAKTPKPIPALVVEPAMVQSVEVIQLEAKPVLAAKETLSDKVTVKFHQIKSKWPQVLIKIKQYNQSLSSSLKISKPDQISDNGTLLIYCPNKFLQTRLTETKNLEILSRVIEEIFGQRLKIEVKVDASLAAVSDKDISEDIAGQPNTPASQGQSQSIDNLLEAFGGRVVE